MSDSSPSYVSQLSVGVERGIRVHCCLRKWHSQRRKATQRNANSGVTISLMFVDLMLTCLTSQLYNESLPLILWCIAPGVMRRHMEWILVSALSLMTLVESPSLSSTRTLSLPVSGGRRGRVQLTKSFIYFLPPAPNCIILCFFRLTITQSQGEWKMVWMLLTNPFITTLKTSPSVCLSHY